jgi:hypothetical protein
MDLVPLNIILLLLNAILSIYGNKCRARARASKHPQSGKAMTHEQKGQAVAHEPGEDSNTLETGLTLQHTSTFRNISQKRSAVVNHGSVSL